MSIDRPRFFQAGDRLIRLGPTVNAVDMQVYDRTAGHFLSDWSDYPRCVEPGGAPDCRELTADAFLTTLNAWRGEETYTPLTTRRRHPLQDPWWDTGAVRWYLDVLEDWYYFGELSRDLTSPAQAALAAGFDGPALRAMAAGPLANTTSHEVWESLLTEIGRDPRVHPWHGLAAASRTAYQLLDGRVTAEEGARRLRFILEEQAGWESWAQEFDGQLEMLVINAEFGGSDEAVFEAIRGIAVRLLRLIEPDDRTPRG